METFWKYRKQSRLAKMKSSLWCGILFAVLDMTKIHDKNPDIRTGMYTSMESVCRRKNASPQQLFSISFGSFCYFVYHNLLLAVSSGKWHIPTKLRPKQVKLKNTFYSNRKRQKFLKIFCISRTNLGQPNSTEISYTFQKQSKFL